MDTATKARHQRSHQNASSIHREPFVVLLCHVFDPDVNKPTAATEQQPQRCHFTVSQEQTLYERRNSAPLQQLPCSTIAAFYVRSDDVVPLGFSSEETLSP